MKILKVLAAVMAVCLLSCAFIACDTESGATETETEAVATKFKASVTLIIKDGDKQVDKETLAFEGNDATLKSVIEFYCAIKDYDSDNCFASTGLLSKIGDLEGTWSGYDEAQGSSAGKIESLQTFEVSDGMTIVLTCTK